MQEAFQHVKISAYSYISGILRLDLCIYFAFIILTTIISYIKNIILCCYVGIKLKIQKYYIPRLQKVSMRFIGIVTPIMATWLSLAQLRKVTK